MIVIGDVHGEFNTLMNLLDILPQTNYLCFVGDLIDRGPDSKKVVDFVKNNNHDCVMGNHEDLLLTDHRLWSLNGAKETLKSFSETNEINLDKFLKSEYIEWFKNLPLTIEYYNKINGKNYLISHSYAFYGTDTPKDDILWGRSFPKIDNQNFINIFGHTPVQNAKKIHDKHWLIDTGVAYGNKLSAIDLITEKIYFIKC
jgi:serine/threonine protein phosphatase 1